MSWNFASRPANAIYQLGYNTYTGLPGSISDYPSGHPFLIWHEGQTVSIPLNATPAEYTVMDYKGNVLVDHQPGTSSTLNLGQLPVGSYRVLFSHPSIVDATYRKSRGEFNVTVWRDVPDMVSKPPYEMYNITANERGEFWPCLHFSTLRLPLDDAADPDTTNPAYVSLSDIVHDNDLWQQRKAEVSADPYRVPVETIIHFRKGVGTYPSGVYTPGTGYDTGVAQVVNQFGTNGYWYECRNEPDIEAGASSDASQFVHELQDFHDYIKAANPNARVLGPNPVNVTSQLGWFETLLSLGGGNYLDGISFHNYNNVEGDLEICRQNVERFIALLTQYGQQNKPRFMTEWGTFAATYGSYTPMRQLRKVMMAIIFWEQYGIPKERFCIFYGFSHGFWDFPSFIAGDKSGLFPTAVAIRAYSYELRSKTFVSRYNFGDEDNDFLGSLYRNPSTGDGVAVFMAGERVGDPMTFRVTGGAGSLTLADAFGKTSTITVRGGKITLNLIGEPTYIRLPNGIDLVPLPRILGRNLVKTGDQALTVSSTGNAEAKYLVQDDPASSYYHVDMPLPITVTLTLGQQTTFDTIYVKGMMPWQVRGAILDATVEVYEGGSWVQAGTIHNTYKWIDHVSYKEDTGCWSETYYNERWSWLVDTGRQIRSDQIRLIVTNTTNGGEVAEVDVAGTGNGQGHSNEVLALQSINIYNSAHATQPEVLLEG